jgi:protein gp37
MSDLFHSDVPFSYINQVFDVIADAWRHTFLILTKRPDRAFEWQCQNGYMPRPNAWMGTSIEGQEHNWRIKYLLRIPSTVRFVSIEPMLGPITFDFESDTCHCGEPHKGHIFENHEFVPLLESYLFGIDWVICGGETGPGAREMNPDWARDIRDQCKATNTPFFMKQMSNRAPIPNDLLIREWPEIHP